MSWTLRGVEAGEIDGLVTLADATPYRPKGHGPREFGADTATTGRTLDRTLNGAERHTPNGAERHIDHVVVVSPDFDRTAAALDAAGLPLRRIRDAGSFRQGFRRLGPAILELVEVNDVPDRPAAFWGLVVTVADLDALALTLGKRLNAVHDAVQPGRRIATMRPFDKRGPALAFMDRER